MKALSMILTVAVVFLAYAQEPKHVDKAPQNLLNALNSDSEQMVETAIFHTLKFRLFYPDISLEKAAKRMVELIRDGQTDKIRYKAYVASYFLNNREVFGLIAKENYKDDNFFFQTLSSTMQKQLLATQQ
jgi:hypothetical protein